MIDRIPTPKPGANPMIAIGIAITSNGHTVTARQWNSTRSAPRPLTQEELAMTDECARVLLNAKPGELVRRQQGTDHVYSRPDVGTVQV